MSSSEMDKAVATRRKLLGSMVSAGALLGLNAAGAAASAPAASGTTQRITKLTMTKAAAGIHFLIATRAAPAISAPITSQ